MKRRLDDYICDAAVKLLAPSRAPAHLHSEGVPRLVRSCGAQRADSGARRAAATCLFKLVSKPITADLRRDSVFTVCSLNLFLFRAADGTISFLLFKRLRRADGKNAPVTGNSAPKFGAWKRREVLLFSAALLGRKAHI